jgi:hypothetical protein
MGEGGTRTITRFGISLHDDDHCGTTSGVLFADILAQDDGKHFFYNTKKDEEKTKKVHNLCT